MSKILIVEDDTYLLTAYRIRMSRTGFDFRLANDGVEALEVLDVWRPDVMLLDLIMPRKDGFETLQAIQSDDNLRTIRIIVTSNLGEMEGLNRAIALGARDYIIKSSVTLDDIITYVTKVIEDPNTPGRNS